MVELAVEPVDQLGELIWLGAGVARCVSGGSRLRGPVDAAADIIEPLMHAAQVGAVGLVVVLSGRAGIDAVLFCLMQDNAIEPVAERHARPARRFAGGSRASGRMPLTLHGTPNFMLASAFEVEAKSPATFVEPARVNGWWIRARSSVHRPTFSRSR